MTRKRAGFTLIEIVIVCVIVGLVTAPFLEVYGNLYGSLHSVARQSALKSAAQRATAAVFRGLIRDPQAVLDADNHGLRFADGQHIYWDGHVLRNGPTPLIDDPVTDFSVVHAHGVWTINLAVSAPLHNHGRPVSLRWVADWPRLTDEESEARK